MEKVNTISMQADAERDDELKSTNYPKANWYHKPTDTWHYGPYKNIFLSFIEWQVINYNTQSYEDTLFIIFHFNRDIEGFKIIEETKEFKDYVKEIKVVAHDLIEHIHLNFYDAQVIGQEYSVLSNFSGYEFDDNDKVVALNLEYPIIDITNETKKANSATNICVQELKGCTPHYLIMHTSYG